MKQYFTSLVRCKDSGKLIMVPVKSKTPVEVKLFIPMSRVLSRIYIGKPVHRGYIICSNILNLNIDIIATKNVE